MHVFEQNPTHATYRFGGVFSHGALAFLDRDVADFYKQLSPRLESWPMQRIVHRGERVDIDGNGFSAIGRLELNGFLQELCANAGVEIAYQRAIAALEEIDGCELLIGADGANSFVRGALEEEFAPRIEMADEPLRLIRNAVKLRVPGLTFRSNSHDHFVAHHYRHSPTMSTFVFECDEATWRGAELDTMSEEESRRYCEGVFGADLNGHPLVSNKSLWRRFPLLKTARWSVSNVVLIGDALRTVHFSIGSGTRLAFEDDIALGRAFGESGGNVAHGLAVFENERRPIVEKSSRRRTPAHSGMNVCRRK